MYSNKKKLLLFLLNIGLPFNLLSNKTQLEIVDAIFQIENEILLKKILKQNIAILHKTNHWIQKYTFKLIFNDDDIELFILIIKNCPNLFNQTFNWEYNSSAKTPIEIFLKNYINSIKIRKKIASLNKYFSNKDIYSFKDESLLQYIQNSFLPSAEELVEEKLSFFKTFISLNKKEFQYLSTVLLEAAKIMDKKKIIFLIKEGITFNTKINNKSVAYLAQEYLTQQLEEAIAWKKDLESQAAPSEDFFKELYSAEQKIKKCELNLTQFKELSS